MISAAEVSAVMELTSTQQEILFEVLGALSVLNSGGGGAAGAAAADGQARAPPSSGAGQEAVLFTHELSLFMFVQLFSKESQQRAESLEVWPEAGPPASLSPGMDGLLSPTRAMTVRTSLSGALAARCQGLGWPRRQRRTLPGGDDKQRSAATGGLRTSAPHSAALTRRRERSVALITPSTTLWSLLCSAPPVANAGKASVRQQLQQHLRHQTQQLRGLGEYLRRNLKTLLELCLDTAPTPAGAAAGVAAGAAAAAAAAAAAVGQRPVKALEVDRLRFVLTPSSGGFSGGGFGGRHAAGAASLQLSGPLLGQGRRGLWSVGCDGGRQASG